MNTGKIAGKIVLVAGTIIMLAMPAMAGNGKGTSMGQGGGDRTRTQSRDQIRTQSRDRSCQDAIEHKDAQQLAGVHEMLKLIIKDKLQDQLQDGSCQAG